MTPLYTCNRESLINSDWLPTVFEDVANDLANYGALVGDSYTGKKVLHGVTYTFTAEDCSSLEDYLQSLADKARNSLWTGPTKVGSWQLGNAVDAFKTGADLPPAYMHESFDRPVLYFVHPGISIDTLIPTVYSWMKATRDPVTRAHPVDFHVTFAEIYGYYNDPEEA